MSLREIETRPILALMLGLIVLSVAEGKTESSRVVLANDVSDLIKSGQQADFDKCTIVGDLDLRNLEINGNVYFNNTLFLDKVNFESTVFNGYDNFESSTFKGPVKFRYSKFNGDANFESSTFNGTADFGWSKFKGNANFVSSNFNETTDFGWSMFNGSAGFGEPSWIGERDNIIGRGSRFNGYADFTHSTFNSGADFGNSKFNSTADFGDSKLNGADFEYSKFNSDANFGDSKFNSDADFEYSKFNGYAHFRSPKFNRTANFGNSKFNSTADFGDSKFNGTADFTFSEFNSDANFGDSKFNSDASFLASKFNGTAYFFYSKFNRTANFRDSNFNSDADFLASKFNSIANFGSSKFNSIANFGSSKFNSTAYFSGSQFTKDAFFIGARLEVLDLSLVKYEKLYLRWSSTDSLVYDANYGDTTYQLLMENFKNLGFSSDFDNCYYQFRVEQFLHRNHLGDPLGSLLDFGALIFYGFGKRPLYPLGWSIVIVLLFGAFWRAIETKEKEDLLDKYGSAREQITYEHPRRSDSWDKVHFVLKPFVLSATIFLSGTKLFVGSPDIPESPKWSRSFVNGMFIFERILGAFFSILLFLAISGTVVR